GMDKAGMDKSAATSPATPVNQAPSNPLLLNGQPAASTNQKGFASYQRSETGAAAPNTKALRLFGYDFFRPAREIIEAHRDVIKRMRERGLDPEEMKSARRRNQDSLRDEPPPRSSRRPSE